MNNPTPENQPNDPSFWVEVKNDKLILCKELTIEQTTVLQDRIGEGKLRAIFNRLGLP